MIVNRPVNKATPAIFSIELNGLKKSSKAGFLPSFIFLAT